MKNQQDIINEIGLKIENICDLPDSAKVLLLKSRKKINEEIAKSPDVVTDEELVQWGVALRMVYSMARDKVKEENKGQECDNSDITEIIKRDITVQNLIGEIMNRPVSEEQLMLLIAVAPGQIRKETNPYFFHYKEFFSDDKHKVGGLLIDEKKSQKFIIAVGSLEIGKPEQTLLKMHILEGDKYINNDAEREVYDKGLASILNLKSQEARRTPYRYAAEEMIKILADLNEENGCVTKIMKKCPLATKALTELQEACIENYRAQLEAKSPLKDLNNFQTRPTSQSDRC